MSETTPQENNANDSFPASKTIGAYTVHKLKLSEYAKVLESLEKMPVLLNEMAGQDKDALFNALPKIIAKAMPEFIAILAIATRTPVEKLDEEMDLVTAVRCTKAMIELNDFLGIWAELKPMFRGLAAKKK